MIIGENRAQVIENIKAAVKKGKMHAKVELGDPILTKSERIKLVNDYWKQQKKLHDQVFDQLKKRSKNSSYQYYHYQKREIGD